MEPQLLKKVLLKMGWIENQTSNLSLISPYTEKPMFYTLPAALAIEKNKVLDEKKWKRKVASIKRSITLEEKNT